MATICSNCQKICAHSGSEFYRESLNVIDNLHFKSIPSAVIDIIIEYAVVSQVKISWITKINILCNCCGCRYDRLARYPASSSDDSSSDADIVYECKRRRELSMFVCSKCFVEGIERCPTRLPYLNKHINECFLTSSKVLTNPYKYIIPPYYKLYFYRSSTPTEIDGKLLISCQ